VDARGLEGEALRVSAQIGRLALLTTIPKSWFSWDLTVLEDSQPVADIHVSNWRERGKLTLQGKDYKVYREGVMTGAFLLEAD
jgi:hypothetical protein